MVNQGFPVRGPFPFLRALPMSQDGFSGRYPGGPRRHPDDDEGRQRRTSPLPSVGEIEEGAQAGSVRRRELARRRRILVGLATAFLLAISVGIWLGWQTARTAAELADEEAGSTPAPLSENDRLMRELIRQQNQPQPQPQTPPRPDPRSPE